MKLNLKMNEQLEQDLYTYQNRDFCKFKKNANFLKKYIEKNNYSIKIDLLPFQNKSIIQLFNRQFWKKFYKNISFIASYYILSDGHCIHNGKVLSYPDAGREQEFEMLCKLKNNIWLYIEMHSEMTFNFAWGPDEYSIYAHENVHTLITQGVAENNYCKLQLSLTNNKIVCNPSHMFCAPFKPYNSDGELDFCNWCRTYIAENTNMLRCLHCFCSHCFRETFRTETDIICAKCSKPTDIALFNKIQTGMLQNKCLI